MSNGLGSKNLGEYLNTVVRTIELKGCTHNYRQMTSTNFGIMAQLLLGYTENQFHEKLGDWEGDSYYFNYRKKDKEVDKLGIWWRSNIKNWWGVNSKPKDYGALFYSLHKCGLSRDRILELEYLDNPIVNEVFKDYDWGIVEKDVFEEKVETKLEPIMVTNVTERWVDDKSFWGRIWGRRKKLTEKTELFTGEHNMIENIVKVKVGTEEVPTNKDFKNREHTLIYYKKWVELIDEANEEKATLQ